jgi:hypothetical protein
MESLINLKNGFIDSEKVTNDTLEELKITFYSREEDLHTHHINDEKMDETLFGFSIDCGQNLVYFGNLTLVEMKEFSKSIQQHIKNLETLYDREILHQKKLGNVV